MGLKPSRKKRFLHGLLNRAPSTERLLSLFLILVISLMSMAMLGLVKKSLQEDLTEQYIAFHNRAAINLGNQVDRFLKVRRIQIQELANNPVVQHGVMQPDASIGLVTDFFTNQRVIGHHYPQLLLDFKGDVIFSSDSIEPLHAVAKSESGKSIPKDFIDAIFQQSLPYLYGATEDGLYWRLLTPVYYRNQVEGILLTFIPLDEMTAEVGLANEENLYFKISTNHGAVLDWGAHPNTGLQELKTQTHGLRIDYAIDTSSLESSFDEASQNLFFSTLALALAASIFALLLGRWFFVRPIERLQAFAKSLSEGEIPELAPSKRMTAEIQELSDQILDMARRIRRREQALIQSNEALKSNQETLVLSEKMAGLGQVTAGVAHEINNPIGFISNNLTMLQEYHTFLKLLVVQLVDLKEKLPAAVQATLSEELQQIEMTLQKEDLDFVINDLDCITSESIAGTERIREITLALKGYVHSGDQNSPTNLNDSIDSTLKMVWNELKYHCSVEKAYSDLPLIMCAGGKINQVLMNLFVNAAHAMEGKKGLLQISTEADDTSVSIKISDNGCGIPKDNLKRIFEPFYTTKAVGQGTGLGMSISYDIIKQHGGEIHVASEVDVGTTFTIKLPIEARED